MAQNDLAGLLTGVSGNRINPMDSNLTPDQQYMAMGAQNVGVMQSGMRGLMGTPSVSEQQAELKSLIAGLNPKIPADAEKLIKYYTITGDRVSAARVANTLEKEQDKQAKALKLENTRLDTISQLNGLGLTEQSDAYAVNAITQAQAGSLIASAIAAKSLPDYSDLNLADPDAVQQALLNEGQISGAADIQASQAKVQQEKDTREALIKRARDMGRLDVVSHLETNGDIAKAETALLKTKVQKVSNLTDNERVEYDSHWKRIDDKKLAQVGVKEAGVIFGFNINADEKFRIELEAENLYTNNPSLGREGALNVVIAQRLGLTPKPIIINNEEGEDVPSGTDNYSTVVVVDEG